MIVRVVNDGGLATHVYDVETGEEIPVRGVTWTHSVGDIPRAEIQVLPPRVDVQAHLVVTSTACPFCGHIEETE